MSDLVVKKSSRLVAASYALSLAEQRTLLLVACGRDDMSANHVVSASEYATAYSTSRQAAYMALNEAAARLFERRFSWVDEDGRRVHHSRWVSRITYNEGGAEVELELSPTVQPLLGDLKRAFTSYNLSSVAALTSAYAIRLYESLIAWSGTKQQLYLELDELRGRLGIEDGKLLPMSDFKRVALDLAVTQINAHTNLHVKYEQRKKGRKIEGFTFHFAVKETPKPAPAKASAPARDADTLDFVNGMTDNEAKGVTLTDKQCGFFASLLAKDPAFIATMGKGKPGGYCYGLGEKEALAQIARDIKHPTPAVLPFLKNAGFKGG